MAHVIQFDYSHQLEQVPVDLVNYESYDVQ